MTPEQRLLELRTAFASNPRLAEMLREEAKHYADLQYRKTKDSVDHAALLRLTGVAAGVEAFINIILAQPVRLKNDRAG